MNPRSPWVVVAALGLIVAALTLLRGGSADSPEHRSTSDAKNGTSALRLYAEALGHPVNAVEGKFELPSSPGLLFLFTPVVSFSNEHAAELKRWVAKGGTLVYSSEMPDPTLDQQLDLERTVVPVSAAAHVPAPLLAGVKKLAGGPVALPYRLGAEQAALLRNPQGAVLGLTARVGEGRLVALADPLMLCNWYLDQADNGRMAADLIGLVSPGVQVLFDEFHHGLSGSDSPSPLGWMRTPWGGAIAWALAVVFVGLALRGRPFGPPLPVRPDQDRSSGEYAAAVGGLLRRTRARALTLHTLAAVTKRAVGERTGLGGNLASRGFSEALAQRAPALSQELAAAEASIARAAESEQSLLALSRQLHALAYPPSEPRFPRRP